MHRCRLRRSRVALGTLCIIRLPWLSSSSSTCGRALLARTIAAGIVVAT